MFLKLQNLHIELHNNQNLLVRIKFSNYATCKHVEEYQTVWKEHDEIIKNVNFEVKFKDEIS